MMGDRETNFEVLMPSSQGIANKNLKRELCFATPLYNDRGWSYPTSLPFLTIIVLRKDRIFLVKTNDSRNIDEFL